MNDVTIARPSPTLELALREVAQVPVAEACVSGLCDMCCLYQTGLCMLAGWRREDSHPSMRSAEQKNKS